MITSLPNLLTLFRIAVIPLMIAGFHLEPPLANWLVLGLFALAGVSDFFDGHIARLRGEVSNLGRFLDPVADKLLVGATILLLVYVDHIDGLTILPALVILCREILVSGLREFLADLRVSVPVSRLAKWKTTFQMMALGFLIVGNAAPAPIPAIEIGVVSLWIAAILTLYTGYDYLRAGARHMT